MTTLRDRNEPIAMMEPLRVPEGARHRAGLVDQALVLARESAALRAGVPGEMVSALADLVRAMNCYYSNLIEGHNTHPVDIERALAEEYSDDARKRDLQVEARSHIAVQRWIDTGALAGRAAEAEAVREIHRRFCDHLPAEMLRVDDPESGARLPLVPGAYRERDVQVGRHVPVSPGAIPRFLERFQAGYTGLGPTESILAAAAAHHRLLWIHPFLDGNGRVARLMSHAMLLDSLDTGAIWSVARGLARNEGRYKALLAACDLPRRNDLDGRGSLSEEALAEFTHFFLEVCLDQVRFMRELMQPDRLRARILLWAEEEIRLGNLPPKSGAVLEAVLYRGQLPRGEVPGLLNMTDRHARRITSVLLESGTLTSESSRAPLRLAFPARLAARWMPGLFPEKPL
ncbi:MAG: Fic family protein [Alphaproteobacteria bacterium]|nr:Fic family protein [Alphaproteobacteria bacterium]